MAAKDVIKKIGLVLRVLAGIALMVFLLRGVDLTLLCHVLQRSAGSWPWWGAGVALTLLGLITGALRWMEVLKVQRIHFSLGKVLHVFFIGQFFNAFMLGACGGDLVRAYYAASGQKGRRAEAAATVFVDRAIGLFVTIMFCCIMIPFQLDMFLDNVGPRDTGVVMILFFFVAVIGLIAVFRKNVFEHFEIFRRLEAMPRLGPLIRRAYDALYLYRHHHRVLVVAILYSLLNLIFLTLACYSFGRALNVDLGMLGYFTLFPIITVLSAIPITPGSLGVRESLFVTMFSAVFVDREHALLLSLTVYFGGLLWSLVGGLLYITVPRIHSEDLKIWAEDGAADSTR